MVKETDIEHINLNNLELQNALQIIQFTHRSLFLTGKAGTGKSTFLRYISQTTKKKHVILAPTGIAAINVGGSTLHSFFKLPFHPLLPNDNRYSVRNLRKTLKYNSEKIKLIKEVELIIIDEISMVRADIIDFIDKILRVYAQNMRVPFGGKQLLLVGDMYQLEPVLKEEERALLQPFYPSKFFLMLMSSERCSLFALNFRKFTDKATRSSSVYWIISEHPMQRKRIYPSSTKELEATTMKPLTHWQSPYLPTEIRWTTSTSNTFNNYQANPLSSMASSKATSPKTICPHP